MIHLIDKLCEERRLPPDGYRRLLDCRDGHTLGYLQQRAQETAVRHFGHEIYIRGLIETGNRCRNNCYYCGIRAGNTALTRYTLSPDEVLACCRRGHALGFRTFVLQSGEQPPSADRPLAALVEAIHREFPDCAITLSVGERSREAYAMFRRAGATRYLLRHETRNEAHYASLHPPGMSLRHRLECLRTLKELGYQTGTGMMAGSPGQTTAHLVEDLLFIEAFQPEMVGIGPFIPHHGTPFARHPAGSLDTTLRLLSIIRLMLPGVLLPATTALTTLCPDGRERGILAGANVVMPNLSPPARRGLYDLYDHKACTGAESAGGLRELEQQLNRIGYTISKEKGDYRHV